MNRRSLASRTASFCTGRAITMDGDGPARAVNQ